MYHKKNVDFAYLLWEDFVYQVENKNVKRSNEMYYPCFTKVIVNFFMTKDSSILRRNRVNWHFARDDPMFTMIKVVSRHEGTQLYGAEPPKTKASVKKKQAGFDKTKTPPTAKGKRLKTSEKAVKHAKKKQPAKTSKAKGLTVLSEVALTEAEQMKLATKISLIQTHSSHTSGSGADEGTGGILGVPDVPTYESNDEQISWKSSDEEDDDDDNDDDDDADNQDDNGQDDDGQEYDGQDDKFQDDDNEKTDSDNDGDEFVHPKFSTHDQEERQDEEDNEEEGSDLRVQTPSHYESTDDEESDEVTHGANVDGEELDEEETNEEDEENELYRDVNVNLEGRDTKMTDALRSTVETTQVIEDTHVIITLVNPEGIDSIFNLNTESTSLGDVPVTTIAETPLSSATTLPSPPIPIITHLKQTLVPTPTIVPSSSLQDLLNFGSLFGFDHRQKTLENDFSEFKQTNQFTVAVSSISGIDDTYLANKMNEATSYAVVANQSELELKKILIDKMESNKSKNLYKALVDAYESDKLIHDTYGDTVSFKRRRDDEDKDEEPSVGSNQVSKRRAGKEPESTSAPKEKNSKTIGKSTEGYKSYHKSADKSAQAEEPMNTHHDWFQKPTKPLTPDHDWNKTLPTTHGLIQPWISSLARKEDTRASFNELMDTPLDFSAFMMNRLKVDTLTPELLAGLTFKLMKGSCKSLVELEYFLEEVYKATTDQLDWNNLKGQQYPHDLRKPLPLIPNLQVNSRAKVPSNKTPKRYKPVEHTSVAKKPERHIPKRYRSSIKQTSVVHEKTMTPRSCLRWKPTGKIFKTVGLKWIPTGKIFTSSTTRGTLNIHAGTSLNPTKEGLRVCSELGIHDHSNEQSSSKLFPKVVPQADKTATSRQELELLFHHQQ
ncbi:hypothetical protein Tco_1155368 [Tanacetum coccineum]